ncbi:serine/threonine-protein kinase [Paucibacter oligotrophus]|uniref:non-specific serine/threonine protein kinase n=1 Tax=Roseateles oligotrophus TaxID=1769250 RepID=A0A840L2B8_9BURK|nr:serine/threonine-protein kinase [Roseateles oligotrophus]MBB4842614.1 serine/threonine-protein kinase [Roseateles oligotrophus]
MSSFWQRILGRSSTPAAAAASSSGLGHKRTDKSSPGLQAYELKQLLGRGAMAVVHLATEKASGRQVAIKRLALQREFAAEDLADVRQRFMREARAAGHLQHADILQVLDAGVDGEDNWIAMEYVQGQDLSHFIRAGQLLPVDEVLALGQRLALALDYAHAQGVIHRDIKPANVMLERRSGVLKIMDFGIARIADGSRTRTGLVLGTPSFMSPEQLAGLKVDGRSDLYSLGVMLYQLLTGRLPHQADSMAQLMYQIANQAPPDVRHYRPELPESLALVLALALEKRPELRYASGQQMAQDLAAVLQELPKPKAELQSAEIKSQEDPDLSDNLTDPFARTLRLELGEAGQNPPASHHSEKP